MEKKDLIDLQHDNYKEWSALMTRYLYQHNVLPYAPKLEFTPDQVNIIIPILCCHLDYKIMDKMCEDRKSVV